MAISGTPSYTSLAKVERVIRTSSKKVNFSNVWRDLTRVAGTGSLAKVTLGSGYAGHQNFTIQFTSATEFTVTVGDAGQGFTDIGNGDIGVDFVSDNGEISILSADWSGSFTTDSLFTFRSLVDMSDDDANLFIVEAERYVDSMARTIYSPRIDVSSATEEALMFASHVPSIVDIATCRFAAYYIISALYFSERDEEDIAGLFLRQSESLLEILMNRIKKSVKNGPQWTARVPVFADTKEQFTDVSETEGVGVLLNEYGIGLNSVEEGIREWKKNISQTLLTS